MDFIRITRDSPSDDEVMVVELLVDEGEQVRKGSVLADLEGSKSSYPLVSPFEGRIFWYLKAGDRGPIGRVVAAVLEEGETAPNVPPTIPDEGAEKLVPSEGDLARFSKSAQQLLTEKGLNPAEILPDFNFVTRSELEQELRTDLRQDGQLAQNGPIRVALVGGGLGATVVREILGAQTRINVVAVFDDSFNALEAFFVPLVGALDSDSIGSVFRAGGFEGAVVTLTANMGRRIELFEICNSLSVPLLTVLDAGAIVSDTASIGEGTVVVSGARIGAFATIGKNVFLSAFVNVDHHCTVGDNTTFGPGVFLSGSVTVGRDCVFGTNIGVEPGVTIGEGSVIASGSTITRDVPARTVVKSQTQLRFRELD